MNGLVTGAAAPERKSEGAPSSLDVVEAFDDFMRSFDAFKKTNDERLKEIEKRVSADVVTDEKMARIDRALDEQSRALDELVLKGMRPALGGTATGPAAREHKAAFHAYVRGGEAHGLKRLEEKALSAGTGPDGGYLVPEETEREIGRRLSELSPIRTISSVRVVSSGLYKKPFSVTGPAVGWVGETEARPETDGPGLAELEFPAMELYAMPAATQSLLDDAAVDIDQWIAEEVETAFAEQETHAFVLGDGVRRPRGFLDYPTVDETDWEWGALGVVASGGEGDFAAADPADRLLDLVFALKAGYRQNARFVMSRRTQSAVRKLKDADGNYLWSPAVEPGGRASLMGFPLVEAEDMPDIAPDAPAIAFGDFRRGYLVVDRLGVRVLRDPYSAKPYVLFYTTKRVGGGVQDFARGE